MGDQLHYPRLTSETDVRKNMVQRFPFSRRQTAANVYLLRSCDFDLDAMTYNQDLDILKMYLHTKKKLLDQGFQKLERQQKRHTDSCDQTHYHAALADDRKLRETRGCRNRSRFSASISGMFVIIGFSVIGRPGSLLQDCLSIEGGPLTLTR